MRRVHELRVDAIDRRALSGPSNPLPVPWAEPLAAETDHWTGRSCRRIGSRRCLAADRTRLGHARDFLSLAVRLFVVLLEID